MVRVILFPLLNVLNADIIYKLNMDFLTKGLDFRVKASYNSSYGQTKNRTWVSLLLSVLISQRMAKSFINVPVTTGIRL